MQIEALCVGCAVRHPSTEHRKILVRNGEPIRERDFIGIEVTYPYKCPACGAIWENFVEQGTGGHSSFWTRIDPPAR